MEDRIDKYDRLNRVFKLYENYKSGKIKDEPQLELEFDLPARDLLKKNLMDHVNGIGQLSNDGEIFNHLIDLKLLIDKI